MAEVLLGVIGSTNVMFALTVSAHVDGCGRGRRRTGAQRGSSAGNMLLIIILLIIISLL